jgi:two-component system cell cycle response regulator
VMADSHQSFAGKNLAETEALITRKLAAAHAALGDFQAAYESMLDYTKKWERLRSARAEATASVMQVMFDLDEVRSESQRYQELAERDALTGLWNRRYLDRWLPGLLEDVARLARPLVIAIVDLDHFKRINDHYSHAVGDVVLREVAGLLVACTGPNAFAVRLGGEEFLLAFVGRNLPSVVDDCEDLRRALQAFPWTEHAPGLAVTTSVGVTGARPEDSVSTLLSRADEHLYRSKRDGRNRVTADARELHSATAA